MRYAYEVYAYLQTKLKKTKPFELFRKDSLKKLSEVYAID